MAKHAPHFPGFVALSDQVFVRHEQVFSQEKRHVSEDPTTVLLYGWGDGLPKHVAKYADGFRRLYPHATQVVVLSPISRAMFSNLAQRSNHMMPVLGAIFNDARVDPSRILVHTMSNTGAVNYAATLHAYQQMYGHAMPHHLLVMDSTPGGTEMSRGNVSRWSRAMALGTAAWFPWPFVVTQLIWAVFLLLHSAYSCMLGIESAGQWSVRAVNSVFYEVKSARRLYLYSKEDDLIMWEDIGKHVAETKLLGRETDSEIFRGSGHVGHMRMFPDQYWGAIRQSWARAIEKGRVGGHK